MIQCPAWNSSQMMAAIPRTWCWMTKLRFPVCIGMTGVVQMTSAGASTPMMKQASEMLVSAKNTARVWKLRSTAMTATA